MLSNLKPIIVVALLSATALANSHSPRAARHHAIAERQPLQGLNLNPPAPVQATKPAKAKRVKRKTCRPRKTTSLAVVATSTAVSVSVSSSSAEAVTTVTSSSKAAVTSSLSTKPIETSSTKPVESSSSKPVETSSTKQVETSSSKATETFVPQTSVTPSSTVDKTTQQATSTHSEEPKTTTQAPPPPPPETTTQKPSSTKTAKAQTTTQANTGSGSGDYVPAQGSQSFLFGQQIGDATFYDTGLTACGGTFSNSDYIVAVSKLLFDAFPGAGANPNANPVCGKKILASMPGGGSVTVTVQDRCEGCDTTSLDFTPSAFNHLGSQAAGRLHGMTWKWVE